MLDFATTVRSRHSVRQFLPTPMTNAQIRKITEDARHAPSSTTLSLGTCISYRATP